jgi:hypothetical protein
MEQVPGATTVTILPNTVQTDGVVELKLTASPELSVAVIANGAAPSTTLLNEPNVIVCDAKKLMGGAMAN